MPTPAELINEAIQQPLTTEDGDRVTLELAPPLSAAEIASLQARLPCAIPADVRELLALCRGFTGGAADFVDFTGEQCAFEYQPAFPHGLPFAADGFGNFWIVDLHPSSNTWGPIYFASHDPPVILYQSPSLEHFLTQLFLVNRPPFKSEVNDVHDDRLFDVWRKNPGVLTHDECIASSDPVLESFARELGPSYLIIDMRNPKTGFGFSWGRFGPETVVRRHGPLPVFSYQKREKRPGLLKSLFGNAGHQDRGSDN